MYEKIHVEKFVDLYLPGEILNNNNFYLGVIEKDKGDGILHIEFTNKESLLDFVSAQLKS